MFRLLSRFIFLLTGWHTKGRLPEGITQAVLVAAPHTSNWDFLYARAALFIMGIPVRFTIKKEWLRFPLSLILYPLGALPIDRSPQARKKGMVQTMAELFKSNQQLIVLVTPEGTRKRADQWKTGFYYLAQQAEVPIVLAYLDYARKEAGIGPVFQPTGAVEEDLKEIRKFYSKITPRFPEQGVF